MKLARARVNSAMNRPAPNLQGAATGNRQQLFQALVHFSQRLQDVETATGGANINLQKPGRKLSPPPYAGISVSGADGALHIQVTNPQFKVARGNPRGTPMYHHLEVTSDPHFSRGIVSLPVTSQNVIQVNRPSGSTNYVRLRSSFDGQTVNSPQYVRGVKS